MPVYVYKCPACEWSCEERYVRPPVEPGKGIACRGCGGTAGRDYANEGVYVNGAASSESIGNISALAHDADGKAYFTDANGQRREVRTAKDVDLWTKSNQLGKPRLVERAGRFVPMKDKNGTLLRESERLIPLGNGPKDVCAGRDDLNEFGVKKDGGVASALERMGDGWVDSPEL